MMENKILAIVNGKEIKQSDVEMLYANLGPNAAQYKGEEGYKQLVEQLILEEMLFTDATENMLHEEADFEKALEQLKKSLLAQYSVSKLMSQIEATEEEAIAYFEENKSDFSTDETVVASHILIETLEEANSIIEEIKGGLEFSTAAQQYSSCPSKNAGGNLGKFGKGQMVPEFEVATFAMNVGDVSEPVKTQFGYHIIQLNEKNAAGEKSFDEVKDEVAKKVVYNKQAAAYGEKQEALKNKFKVEYKF